MKTELLSFQRAVAEFLALPQEEADRRLKVAALRAGEISDRFDAACRFSTDEDRRFLGMPMTI